MNVCVIVLSDTHFSLIQTGLLICYNIITLITLMWEGWVSDRLFRLWSWIIASDIMIMKQLCLFI